MKMAFLTLRERHAYGLTKHLRNAGLSPNLKLIRDPSGAFIYRAMVECECDRWQWELAIERMYSEQKEDAA